jgi:uncharacterized protein YxjI
MRFLLKQKLFSLGDDFYIKDQDGRDVYFVDGRMLSIGDQLSFQDLEGNELAFIKQRVLSLGKTYEISRGGQVVAVVKKALFSPFHHHFQVDVPGPDDLEAEGNFLDREYTITRGDRVVATVSKAWFTWADSYGIEIDDGEDAILILACAVVIDEACHPDDGKRH